MRKLTILLLCLIALFCTAFSVTAFAETPTGTITMVYSTTDTTFADIEINAYHIADYDGLGNLTLEYPFTTYPISFPDIDSQDDWKDLATTLMGCISSHNPTPEFTVSTNASGFVSMNNARWGLYFVPGMSVFKDYVFYTFEPAFIYMPQRSDDNPFVFNVSVRPKCSVFVPQASYIVEKLWQDSGKTGKRPQQVEVEIYRNDTLWDTVVLNSDNEWFAEWQAHADDSVWTVMEKDVPAGYTVSITENNGIFSIVNKYKTSPTPTPEPTPPGGIKVPDTGDNSNFNLYIALMCISGLLLLVLGVYRNRRNNEEN